ncbi:MAG TPA: metal transporter [Deltaproteobacteria bacterium]|nr:metal transporter [Deltaproteobacteria bacterium]HPR55524.1 metal transporter [Deltaproteobacteria bacterium]HXK48352.1 metal transporter [Deltaproteobacteria bacterium]
MDHIRETTDLSFEQYGVLLKGLERLMGLSLAFSGATREKILANETYFNGVFKYINEFMTPFWIALNSFSATERDKLVRHTPEENTRDYLELLLFNIQVAVKGMDSTIKAAGDFHLNELSRAFNAWLNTIFDREGEDIQAFVERQARLLTKVVYEYPRAIDDIGTDYGFHFEQAGYRKLAETERFTVYQVLPRRSVKVSQRHKPILIIPPYVLGVNILGFLPGDGKSYAHAYADQGIPTYVRVLKDIEETPAVQTMTGEDDALDTRYFCEVIKEKHGLPVTLNGFCQGGFVALLDILTGELDGLVDALITCVAPMDGTRSRALIEYLEHLPSRFRDLGYAVKELPNGNGVVDGKVMSWVYKLKSMEKEAPIYTLYRDLMMFDDPAGKDVKITRTAAALNHWLLYDRKDIPEAITKMSFDSYTVPIAEDGTMPVSLFGKKLNIKRIKEKGIRFLICYAESDDLVDRDSALAPLDYVDAEVTVFPKGHGAIATTWSAPDTEYAIHKRLPNGMRGPVRFQLDLDEEVGKGKKHG